MYGTGVDLRDMNRTQIRPFEDIIPEAGVDEEVPTAVEPSRNSRQVLPADTVEFGWHVVVLVEKTSLYAMSANISCADEPQRFSGPIG